MQPQPSFAPLAGRLAAKVAEIRPAAAAENSWANFMALFWCAIFEMLILLCEALDARAALDAAAARDGKPLAVPAKRAGMRGAYRAPARSRDVQALAPEREDAPVGAAEAPRAGPWLAWSRPAGPCRPLAVAKVGFFREKSGFRTGFQPAYFIMIS